MNNYKYIDIAQLPDDLWQDAKNVIALDSNGEIIKAAKEDTYSKEEIDDLLKDAEISADKLQNKIKIDSASTDYVITQPTVSGDSLVLTDSMSDKNQYHTFGYDKTITTTSNKLLDYSTPLFRGTNDYNCPQWDGNSIMFTNQAGRKFKTRLTIPYTYNGVKYVTHFDIDIKSQMYTLNFGVINDPNFPGYQAVKFRESEVYKAFGANGTFVFKTNNTIKDYGVLSPSMDSTYDFIYDGMNIEITIGNFPLSNGALIIETPRFYILSNNFIYGDVPTESQSSDHPEKLSDYIRYSNDVKAYILTDKNTKFKTINGAQITGEGNIEVATKSELATKQDVISDLDAIRSGAALGATALQAVPSEYATEQWVNEQGFLKEHQDISNLATKAELATKQDTLVSGTNIKTVNGTSLLGSGNIVIEASADNVPTLQTTKQGTTNNYVYSSGQKDKYGIISDFYTAISYEQDRASIHTDWYYWGNTDEYMVDGAAGWSIEGATTSQAGLMSASDKTKLDGIDLSTKQDKLVSGTNIKTVNGNSLLGSGDITIEGGSGNVDLTDYYTKSETNALVNPKISQVTLTQAEYDALSTKENNVLYVISDAEDIKFKTINGAQITGEGNIEVATKSELSTKQDVISDLETIRSGAALGATALQSVPSTYALKSEIPDITTKQDTLISGTNIKTINGTSLLGSGNIEISTDVNISDYYTKAEIDAMIGGASTTITEINNLVV